MEYIDLPLTALVLILFGLVALFLIVKNFRMPGDFEKKQWMRSEIRKKIIAKQSEQDDLMKDDDSDQVN